MATPERVIKPVAGGSGPATGTAAAVPAAARAEVPRMGTVARLLEDERVLGVLLLLPTIVLLGLFIAYPFVKGVYLSLTSATVGNPGQFVNVDSGGVFA